MPSRPTANESPGSDRSAGLGVDARPSSPVSAGADPTEVVPVSKDERPQSGTRWECMRIAALAVAIARLIESLTHRG